LHWNGSLDGVSAVGSDRAQPRRFDLAINAGNFVNPQGSAATSVVIDSPRFMPIAPIPSDDGTLQFHRLPSLSNADDAR
jgi:hypothetical protein